MEENNLQQENGYGQPVSAPQNSGRKKGRGAVIAAAAAAAVLLLTVAAVLVYRLVLNSPEARLTRGFANLAKELAGYENPMLQEIGCDAIAEKIKTEPYSMEMGLDVTVPELGNFGTIGMDIQIDSDRSNRLQTGNIVLSAFNIRLLEGVVTAADNRLYMSVPSLTEGAYYISTDSLGRDYNASPWAALLGFELDEDFSWELFSEKEDPDQRLMKVVGENLENIRDTMTVEDTGDTFEIYSGSRTVKCSGVRVTLDGLAVNRLLTELNEELKGSGYEDTFSFSLAEDAAVSIYMDNRGRIIRMQTPEKVGLEGSWAETLEFEIAFTGEESRTSATEVRVWLTSEDTELLISMDSNIHMKEEGCEYHFEMTAEEDREEVTRLRYDDEWDYDLREYAGTVLLDSYGSSYEAETECSFDDIVAGESFTVNLGRMNLQMNGQELLKVTGKMGVAPFEGTIEEPDGATDLFGMSKEEIAVLMEEMLGSMPGLLW